jgi:hypothetical protein
LKAPKYNKEALHNLMTSLGFDHTLFNAGWLVVSHYR